MTGCPRASRCPQAWTFHRLHLLRRRIAIRRSSPGRRQKRTHHPSCRTSRPHCCCSRLRFERRRSGSPRPGHRPRSTRNSSNRCCSIRSCRWSCSTESPTTRTASTFRRSSRWSPTIPRAWTCRRSSRSHRSGSWKRNRTNPKSRLTIHRRRSWACRRRSTTRIAARRIRQRGRPKRHRRVSYVSPARAVGSMMDVFAWLHLYLPTLRRSNWRLPAGLCDRGAERWLTCVATSFRWLIEEWVPRERSSDDLKVYSGRAATA